MLKDAVATVPARRAMLTFAPVTGAVGSPAGADEVGTVLETFEDDGTTGVLEETSVDDNEGAEVVRTELLLLV